MKRTFKFDSKNAEMKDVMDAISIINNINNGELVVIQVKPSYKDIDRNELFAFNEKNIPKNLYFDIDTSRCDAGKVKMNTIKATDSIDKKTNLITQSPIQYK
jgi:hypothetical protein